MKIISKIPEKYYFLIFNTFCILLFISFFLLSYSINKQEKLDQIVKMLNIEINEINEIQTEMNSVIRKKIDTTSAASCNDEMTNLLDLTVLENPTIRSLSIIKTGENLNVCSSMSYVSKDMDTINALLSFRSGFSVSKSLLTPEKPIFVFKERYKNSYIIAIAETYNLQNILNFETISKDNPYRYSLTISDTKNEIEIIGNNDFKSKNNVTIINEIIGNKDFNSKENVKITNEIKFKPNEKLEATLKIYNSTNEIYFFLKEYSLPFLILFCFLILITKKIDKHLIDRYLLIKGMINHEFVPFIQKIVFSENGETIGGEILMRWNKTGKGIVMPGEFIPLIDKCGLSVQFSQYILREVKTLLIDNIDTIPKDFKININIPPAYLGDKNIIKDCKSFLHNLSNIELTLEITEFENIIFTNEMVETLISIKELGILIAIDDFGTGFSSYSYLQNDYFDVLKIDRIFINNISNNISNQNIVRSLVELCSKLKLKIVAEGVENNHDCNMLRELGVIYQQGWLWGKAETFNFFIDELQEK